MSLTARLKDLITERKTALDVANKLISNAAKEKRAMTAEETTEFEKRHEAGNSLLTQITQLETQIAADASLNATRPDHRRAGEEDITHRRTDDEPELDEKQRAEIEKMNYRAFLRGGSNALPASVRAEYDAMMKDLPAELRALATTSVSVGAAMIPQGFMPQIDMALLYYGGIIEAADYIPTASGEALPWPTDDDTANTAEQQTEGSGVTTSGADPTYGQVTFGAYMLDSKVVKVSMQLMNDSIFPLEAHLNEKLGTRIGRRLNTLATTGAGTTTLKGVVTAASAGPTIFPATTIGYSDLIDLEYSVNRAYRNPKNPKVGYMFHDTTMKILRKLTDDSNNPIFRVGGVQDGLSNNREPDTLNGWPVWINNDMAVPAQGAKTVLFGDFSKYKIRRVGQMVVFRFDQLYMESLQIGFLAYQRFDGNLLNTAAIKYLTQGAS